MRKSTIGYDASYSTLEVVISIIKVGGIAKKVKVIVCCPVCEQFRVNPMCFLEKEYVNVIV